MIHSFLILHANPMTINHSDNEDNNLLMISSLEQFEIEIVLSLLLSPLIIAIYCLQSLLQPVNAYTPLWKTQQIRQSLTYLFICSSFNWLGSNLQIQLIILKLDTTLLWVWLDVDLKTRTAWIHHFHILVKNFFCYFCGGTHFHSFLSRIQSNACKYNRCKTKLHKLNDLIKTERKITIILRFASFQQNTSIESLQLIYQNRLIN